MESTYISESRDTARAMSQADLGIDEKRKIVRAAYEAFNRRRLDDLRPLLHPEFEVDLSNSLGFDRERYTGEEGVKRFWETYWDSFESISIEVEDWIEGETALVAIIRARGQGLGSGVEVDARGPHLWSFKGDRAEKLALYEHLHEALEAAGLSE